MKKFMKIMRNVVIGLVGFTVLIIVLVMVNVSNDGAEVVEPAKATVEVFGEIYEVVGEETFRVCEVLK